MHTESNVLTALISVVDDDESIRDATGTLLRSVGYQVATFHTGELFLESDALVRTECLILDIRLPGIDGLELQRRLNASGVGVPIIFMTAHYDQRNRQRAINEGASDFFGKPFAASELLTAIRTALTSSPIKSGTRSLDEEN